MNTPKSKTDFILLFRGPDWDQGLTMEQTQQVLDQVMAWVDGLQRRGLVKGGQALGRVGRIVSGRSGQRLVDGPFPESKEAVGGYLVIQAESLDEAVEIARACPTVDYNISIDVRPVLGECPITKRLQERRALATA